MSDPVVKVAEADLSTAQLSPEHINRETVRQRWRKGGQMAGQPGSLSSSHQFD